MLFTLSHIYDLIEYSDSDLMIRYSLFESNWKFTVGQQQPADDRRANFNFKTMENTNDTFKPKWLRLD